MVTNINIETRPEVEFTASESTKYQFGGLNLVARSEEGGLIIHNSALRDCDVEGVTGEIRSSFLKEVAVCGDCRINNWDWARLPLALFNPYIDGEFDINIITPPETNSGWLIVTYPDIDDYRTLYDEYGDYEAPCRAKRNISITTWGSDLRSEWYRCRAYSPERLKHIAENGYEAWFEQKLRDHLVAQDHLVTYLA